MSLMIKDLLEYACTRLGKHIPITPLAYDIGHVCEAARDETQAAHLDGVFDLEMVGDLRAQIDPARLEQDLSNLLNNAIQYGTTGLPITLSARGGRDVVEIDARNQGAVIPQDALQVIFNPLVQLRTEHGGAPAPLSTSLGLGMFMAREIVMGHGGTLQVASSSSEGTVFRVRLPRAFEQDGRDSLRGAGAFQRLRSAMAGARWREVLVRRYGSAGLRRTLQAAVSAKRRLRRPLR